MLSTTISKAIALTLAAVGLLLQVESAAAQGYPERTVRLIVPFAAGGGVGVFGQQLVAHLGPELGQEIVLEYLPGSGGMIGAAAVAQAAPDGYTLLLSTAGPIEVSPVTYENVPFDPIEDFEHITRLGSVPYILVAHKKLGVKTLEEFIELAKKQPGALSYGSSGSGTINFLAAELLKSRAGIDLVHIPYQGNGPQMVDLVAGRLDVSMLVPNAITQYVDDGTLIPLATTGSERSSNYPDVPTFKELGVDVEVSSWYGISAPRGTDPKIIAALDETSRKLMQGDSLPAALKGLGIDADVSASPEEFEKDIAAQLALWAQVMKQAGIEKIK